MLASQFLYFKELTAIDCICRCCGDFAFCQVSNLRTVCTFKCNRAVIRLAIYFIIFHGKIIKFADIAGKTVSHILQLPFCCSPVISDMGFLPCFIVLPFRVGQAGNGISEWLAIDFDAAGIDVCAINFSSIAK